MVMNTSIQKHHFISVVHMLTMKKLLINYQTKTKKLTDLLEKYKEKFGEIDGQ